MSSRTAGLAITTALYLFTTPAAAQLEGLLDSLKQLPVIGGDSAVALTNDDIIAGLKEALGQGAERAIRQLGREDGYFGDPKVKIPLPGTLDKVESALRALGQDRYADEFVLSMNRAAEQAVPQAAEVFANVLQEMTVEDAKAILEGPDDAATQYLREVGGKDLRRRMRPIVEEATSAVGVTSAYKRVVDKAGVAAKLAGAESLDIDRYVTNRALRGLYALIAAEERRIRENPVARTTELMKKVFAQ